MLPGSTVETAKTALAVPLVLALNSAGPTLVIPGPETLVFAGVHIPVLSAGLGMIGVILGHLLAPAPAAPLGARRIAALITALLLLELGIVIASGQMPLVAMGWGIGLGFSGYTIAATLGAQASGGVKQITQAFFDMIAARIGGGAKGKDSGNG